MQLSLLHRGSDKGRSANQGSTEASPPIDINIDMMGEYQLMASIGYLDSMPFEDELSCDVKYVDLGVI